ncbi:hypothetical protein R1sor_003970 [Riccia sorocarpa]|uniref:Uncharacterized protein n=1 Tax=Riccia sorocarpa TaxID=122646 RepID=A0ABD3H3I7_9MARC
MYRDTTDQLVLRARALVCVNVLALWLQRNGEQNAGSLAEEKTVEERSEVKKAHDRVDTERQGREASGQPGRLDKSVKEGGGVGERPKEARGLARSLLTPSARGPKSDGPAVSSFAGCSNLFPTFQRCHYSLTLVLVPSKTCMRYEATSDCAKCQFMFLESPRTVADSPSLCGLFNYCENHEANTWHSSSPKNVM